ERRKKERKKERKRDPSPWCRAGRHGDHPLHMQLFMYVHVCLFIYLLLFFCFVPADVCEKDSKYSYIHLYSVPFIRCSYICVFVCMCLCMCLCLCVCFMMGGKCL